MDSADQSAHQGRLPAEQQPSHTKRTFFGGIYLDPSSRLGICSGTKLVVTHYPLVLCTSSSTTTFTSNGWVEANQVELAGGQLLAEPNQLAS
jgi:hypothetical protein